VSSAAPPLKPELTRSSARSKLVRGGAARKPGQSAKRARPTISLYNRAVGYLARREHSRAELARKLSKFVGTENSKDRSSDDAAGLDVNDSNSSFFAEAAPPLPTPADLEAVLDKLVEANLLSDERYTSSLLHQRAGRYGSQRLKQDLKQQGVGEHLVEQAMTHAKTDDYAQAKALWVRKFGSGSGSDADEDEEEGDTPPAAERPHPAAARNQARDRARAKADAAHKARAKQSAFLLRRGFPMSVVSRVLREAGVAGEGFEEE
jgi:regulatory protein